MRIPLAPSGLREKDIEAIVKVLKSGNLTMGEQVHEFEREMASYLGVKNFVMVNSGSSANLAIFEALVRPTRKEPLLQAGDEVLVPVIAWPTTVWPIVQFNLKPIFIDVEEHSLAIDLEKAEQYLQESKSHRVKAIFPIHALGLGINKEILTDFVRRNNLLLINDVCESLGSWQGSEHSGTDGLMSSFSFYFSHHMTTMEGGGISSNEDHLNNDLRSIRSHGWSRDRRDVEDWSFEIHPSLKKFNFVSTGFNIRPMEIQAAVGRLQLQDLDNFISLRRKHVAKISQQLTESHFQIIGDNKNILDFRQHSWMHIPIRIVSSNASEKRLRVIRFLEDAGVETRPPLTGNFLNQPAMARYSQQKSEDFVTANAITNSTFLVGCHHDLTESQIEYLAKCLVDASRLI